MEPDLHITHVFTEAAAEGRDEERDLIVQYLLDMADHNEKAHTTANPPITLRWVAKEIRSNMHRGALPS